MKDRMKKIFAVLITVIVIFVQIPPISISAAPATYSKQSNSGTRDEVCTSLSGTSAGSYYTGIYSYDTLNDYSGEALRVKLQTLMKKNHSTTSYDDCRDYVWRTDCENNNTSKATTLYTDFSMSSSHWKDGGWKCNREHVWPQSSGGGNTSGGGSDLHHIRPSEANVNSSRGNKPYGNGGSSSIKGSLSSSVGGTYTSTYFEPNDNVKGDVARIILYVYTRWNSEWGATNLSSVFQSTDVLLQWCKEDPVDTWEMGRNEVVQSIQGNRNVFIDYPELAWLVLGRSVPQDMTTPSGEAKAGNTGSSNSGGSTGGNTGGSTGGNTGGSTSGGTTTPGTSCTHSETKLINIESATCLKDGYTGDQVCKACNVLIEVGSAITALGHKYGADEPFKEATETEYGLRRKVCERCQNEEFTVIPKLNKSNSLPIDLNLDLNQDTVVIGGVAVGGIAVIAVLFFLFKKMFLG